MLAATLQLCSSAALQQLYSWIDIFFLAEANMAELDGGGTVVAELDRDGAMVAPSKPSKSIGLSRSTGMGEGKFAIRDSMLSCCRWYSWWSLASDCWQL